MIFQTHSFLFFLTPTQLLPRSPPHQAVGFGGLAALVKPAALGAQVLGALQAAPGRGQLFIALVALELARPRKERIKTSERRIRVLNFDPGVGGSIASRRRMQSKAKSKCRVTSNA